MVMNETNQPTSTDFYFYRVLLPIFLLFMIGCVALTSFTISNERYFSLIDDAMISMRYARNIAEGYGAVWNPGEEPVEGYSNPLWVAVMVLAHLLPVETSKISLVVQGLAVLLLLGHIVIVYRLARTFFTFTNRMLLFAVCLCFFYWPTLYFGLYGMEVSLIVCLLSLALYRLMENLSERRFTLFPLILLFLLTWVRMDLFVTAAAIVAYLCFAAEQPHRTRYAVWGVSLLAFSSIAQTTGRFLYYHELLPNTYYIKIHGIDVIERLRRGVYYTVFTVNPLLYILIYLYRRRLITKETGLLLWVFMVQVAYNLYTGGDTWEYAGSRFLLIAMPGFLLLVLASLQELFQRFPQQGVKFCAIGSLFFLLNYHQGLFNLINFVTHHLRISGNYTLVYSALLIDEITTPEATVAVTLAGVTPYFSNRTFIDIFGKCDKTIARQDVDRDSYVMKTHGFLPGHYKYNLDYSITSRSPDIVFAPSLPLSELAPYVTHYLQLTAEHTTLLLKNSSNHLRMDAINPSFNLQPVAEVLQGRQTQIP